MGCCWLLRRCLARIRQVAGLLLRLTSQPCALEDSIRRRLVEAWVAAERSSITFSLKLQRGTGDNQADLIVSSRERALEPAKFHGARLRKEHYRNGGVARSRFVLCDDEDEGKLLAVFGLFGHFAEGAPFMQLAGSFSETSDLLDRCEDWTVVSTQPVLIEVPEEVRQEAARIARIKADELWGLQMLGDGNMRNFVLRSTSSITDPKELRMNLYIDSFAASTKAAHLTGGGLELCDLLGRCRGGRLGAAVAVWALLPWRLHQGLAPARAAVSAGPLWCASGSPGSCAQAHGVSRA
ncbi:unnamed protein product [Durusdinium trenchii]|uniref:Uncharacterized protein n=2 Tax=Durusdinium trenchii TaxID=1381693 RepID=A0ABP0HT60_9DINO